MTSAGSSAPGADWRAGLDGLLRSAPTAAAEAVRTELALQFQLRELVRRDQHSWNGPATKTAGRRGSARPGTGEFRLAVRPATSSAKGWQGGGATTWRSVAHLRHRLGLDPAQQRWFLQLAALHRAGDDPGSAGPEWLLLDDFASPVLWTLLAEAQSLRIALVMSFSGRPVRLGRRAELGLAAEATEQGLALRPRLSIDGAAEEPAQASPVADHGVYLIDRGDPAVATVAPLDRPLTAERRALLGPAAAPALQVPAAEVPHFVAEYLPRLRERVGVADPDGGVLPPPPDPALVLTTAFEPGGALRLSWRWEAPFGASPPAPGALLPADLLPPAWLRHDAPGAVPLAAALDDLDAADFVADVLPRLEAAPGVRVEQAGDRPRLHELTGTPCLTITPVAGERPDWLDLDVVVTVDGRTIPFLPLFRALAAGRRRLLLADGAHLSLAHPALAPLAELVAEAAELTEWRTGLRVDRHRAALLAGFEDLADGSAPALAWRALLAEVRQGPRPLAPPAGLAAVLRPYQAEGFAWLAFLWRHRLGGVLADDMGLGKTLQCLALVLHAAADAGPEQRRPFLVVAPTSVVSTWAEQAARFAPGLVVRTARGSAAAGGPALTTLTAGADLVVTSYALLRLDAEPLRAVAERSGFAGVILDEAQFVKNPASRAHEVVRDLGVPFVLAVTGTPLENSLTELQAILALVAPGLLPSARRFREEYVRPIERPRAGLQRGVGAGRAPVVAEAMRRERLARLRARIRPFVLRRTKEQVAPELPAKQEQVVTVELGPEHRALYDLWLHRERRKLLGLIDDLDRSRFIVFRSLTLLRMLALDAALIDPEHDAVPSAKLDALLERLTVLLAEGHRALVFSQFTSYLARVRQRLAAAGIATALLDGGTRDRDAAIDAFRSGAAPVFLVSLKAGGFGLNLVEADAVFLLDPWWNPAAEAQAVDRAHRIGQTRPVMVYRLVAAGTIEEKVMALKARKAALFDAVVDDEQLFAEAISDDDIRALVTG